MLLVAAFKAHEATGSFELPLAGLSSISRAHDYAHARQADRAHTAHTYATRLLTRFNTRRRARPELRHSVSEGQFSRRPPPLPAF